MLISETRTHSHDREIAASETSISENSKLLYGQLVLIAIFALAALLRWAM